MWTLPSYGDYLERYHPGLRKQMAEAGAPEGFEDVVATINPIADDQPETPARWSVTFAVDDAYATAAKATELGGKVIVPPFDAPWVRMTVIADPQGRGSSPASSRAKTCAGHSLTESSARVRSGGYVEVRVEESGTNRARRNETPEAVPDASATAPTGRRNAGLSADQRKATLDRTLQIQEAQGWRIEARSDFQATIAKGKPLNNMLHLLLTIVTLGIWGIVWASLAITGGVKRRTITIDEDGNVIDSIV
jgi:Glyoxalase-like domain